MFFYNHHIGDFRSGTVNMTRQTRWIYRDMIDVYYDTEQPLPLDLEVLCDMLGVETDEERKIVERILRFKFQKTDEGYRHVRCDEELTEYRKKGDVARENGKKGGRKPNPAKTEQEPSGLANGTGSQTNHKPITNNQEPETKDSSTPLANSSPGQVDLLGEPIEKMQAPVVADQPAPVDQVFTHWQHVMRHPQAKLDAKRRKAITSRIKDGYTVDQLIQAINGCTLSDHHMGRTKENQTVYDDIELICRDGPRVDKFIKLAERGAPRNDGLSDNTRRQVANLQRYIEENPDERQ